MNLKRILLGVLPGVLSLILVVVFILFGFKDVEALLIAGLFSIGAGMFAKSQIEGPFGKLYADGGIGCLVVDSTAVMVPLIGKYNRPFVSFNFGRRIETVFSRDIVHGMTAPIDGKLIDFKYRASDKDDEKEYMAFIISKEKFMHAKFSLMQVPFILYNSVKDSFYTKKEFGTFENDAGVSHILLHMIRQLEEMLSIDRGRERFISEKYKPVKSWFENDMLKWIIIVVVGVILLYLAWPTLSSVLFGAADTVGTVASNTTGVLPSTTAGIVPSTGARP
jgi:hypothetical protein